MTTYRNRIMGVIRGIIATEFIAHGSPHFFSVLQLVKPAELQQRESPPVGSVMYSRLILPPFI